MQRKSVGHTKKIDFKGDAKITQNRRNVPLQLQQAVDEEIKNFLEKVRIRNVDKKTDDLIIQLVVITVRKGRSIKLALDAGSRNNVIRKTKYQMPNLKSLMENVAEIVNQQGRRCFVYLLGHAVLIWSNCVSPKNVKQYNFQIVGGESRDICNEHRIL